MNISDFIIIEENGVIKSIKHNEYDTVDFSLDEEYKTDIKKKALDFIEGKTKSFCVWSDYDFEEPSNICYCYKNKYCDLELICCMEKLIVAINSGSDVWHVGVEDSLL